MLDFDPRDYDSRDDERHSHAPTAEAAVTPATTDAITTGDNPTLGRATAVGVTSGRSDAVLETTGKGRGPGRERELEALITFDIWIIQHDIDLLRQLCEAYGYCNPTPSNSRECAAKQWTCTVRCAVIDLRTGSAVRYIETEGVGSSPEEAFKDGQKRLQNSTPQGFRTKHCHTVGRCTQK